MTDVWEAEKGTAEQWLLEAGRTMTRGLKLDAEGKPAARLTEAAAVMALVGIGQSVLVLAEAVRALQSRPPTELAVQEAAELTQSFTELMEEHVERVILGEDDDDDEEDDD